MEHILWGGGEKYGWLLRTIASTSNGCDFQTFSLGR